MKILIVGAGISGLTLACFLKRQDGFEVEIVDKAVDWSHLGYTLGVWDLGRRILAKLDLDDEFDRLSHPIHSFYFTDKSARQVLKLYHFEDFYKKYESAFTHISRKDLHDLLLNSCGSDVRMEVSPVSVRENADSVEVTFSDGKKDTYDLIVGADGLRSKVRELIFPDDKVDYTGNRVWFTWVPREFVPSQTIMEIVGKDTVCNLFDDPTQACMVLTAPETPLSFDEPATRMGRLQKHFKGFGYPVPEILAGLRGENLMPTDIGFVNSNDWVKDRVVLIGDAAHAMEPFAGIGASMGMEDAYVLADELSQIGPSGIPDKALNRYILRRLPRINAARRQTRLQYWWLTSRIPGVAFVRKLFAPIIPISHFTKGYKKLLSVEP
jgi:2-polyprenyl-6-methoxyphenol hydroxylase-like FAD-dependent oxidoreductase